MSEKMIPLSEIKRFVDNFIETMNLGKCSYKRELLENWIKELEG